MKTLVEYDSSTGQVVDFTGVFVAAGVPNLTYAPFSTPEVESKSDVDKLIKLKGAGFTAEEIIMLLASES